MVAVIRLGASPACLPCCPDCGEIVWGDPSFFACTVQNVSGCPCVEGANNAFFAPRAFPCIADTIGFGLQVSMGSGSACEGDDVLFFGNVILQCCTIDGKNILVLLFSMQDSHSPPGVVSVNASSPGGGLTVVSYTPSPFELVLEANTLASSTVCYPGRLRFIFTHL